jgi:hypothetical protein
MDDRFMNTNWDEEYLKIKDSLMAKYAEILKTKQGEAKYKYSDSKTIFTDEIIDLLDKESEAIRGKKYITPSQPSHCEFKETLFYTFQDRYDGHFKKGYEIDEFLVLTVEKIREEKIKEFHTSGESHRKAYFNDIQFLEEAQSEEIFQLVAKLDVIRLIMDRSMGYELYQSSIQKPTQSQLAYYYYFMQEVDLRPSFDDIVSKKIVNNKKLSVPHVLPEVSEYGHSDESFFKKYDKMQRSKAFTHRDCKIKDVEVAISLLEEKKYKKATSLLEEKEWEEAIELAKKFLELAKNLFE